MFGITDDRILGRSGLFIIQEEFDVKTAGPSPNNNKRTEVFLNGCEKARLGYPCPGCFNYTTWDNTKDKISHIPELYVERITQLTDSKFVTIGGGEPLDQIDNLIRLVKELKKQGFHIIVYTWRRLEELLKPYYLIGCNKVDFLEHCIDHRKVKELLNYIDILIDGQYIAEQRLWNGKKGDGLISSVGSGNQKIWDIHSMTGYKMSELESISLDEHNNLIFKLKEDK